MTLSDKIKHMSIEMPELTPPANETVPPIAETKKAPELAIAEKGPLEKVVDDPGVLGARTKQIQMLRAGFEVAKTAYTKTQSALEGAGERLGLDGQTINAPAQTISEEHLSREAEQIVETEANYPGDWTLLLKERLLHPSMQEKMNTLVATHRDSFKAGEPTTFEKHNTFQSFIDQMGKAENFQARVEDRFQVTGSESAAQYTATPNNHGIANFQLETESSREELKNSGAVFLDAEKNGKPLTTRQKNIIEAHEKGHAVRTFPGAIGAELRRAFDPEAIRSTHVIKESYLFHPDEIAERMSQLKNYFGFQGNEEFTAKHLTHARESYITDTGLDNDMSAFLAAITPKTEAQFLKVINEYPI